MQLSNHSDYDSVTYDVHVAVKTRLSELEAEVQEKNNHCVRIWALSLVGSSASAQLLNLTIQFSLDHNHKKNYKKINKVLILLSPILLSLLDFQKVVSSLTTMTPTTTLTSTLSLVKTSNNPFPLFSVRQIENNRKTIEKKPYPKTITAATL